MVENQFTEKEKLQLNIFKKIISGRLSGLRQFLATESPLNLMKNVFFHLKNSLCSWDI